MGEKKIGGIRRFWSKLADRQSNLEKTQMSPEFLELTKNYDAYKESNDILVEKLEACIQQNRSTIASGKIIDIPNENPYEKLSNAFFLLYGCLPPDKITTIQSLISITQNLAKVQRENQLNGRKAIRHLRRFFTVEYKELTDERTKLEKTRADMDRMKHEVKIANTTEKIEKYAILYEQAVEEFDGQARRTIVLLNQLPKIKTIHLKDIVEFWSILHEYHEQSAQCIDIKSIE
uniref:BAR domain-containing protein n=1 Tax=Wuchereria bancrofti TaxID=6293 RepID=A0AAF5PNY8_WUCBA